MIERREQRTLSGKPGAAAGTAGASFALFSHQPRRSSIVASICCLLDDRGGWHATAASARFAVQQSCCWCCWCTCCQFLQTHIAACYNCAPNDHSLYQNADHHVCVLLDAAAAAGLPVALPRPLGRHRPSVTPTPLLLLLPGHAPPVLTGSSIAPQHPSPYHDTTNHHPAATT